MKLDVLPGGHASGPESPPDASPVGMVESPGGADESWLPVPESPGCVVPESPPGLTWFPPDVVDEHPIAPIETPTAAADTQTIKLRNDMTPPTGCKEGES